MRVARAQQRLIEETWRASRLEPWFDTAIRVLDPQDSGLLRLAVNRGWGSVGLRPKTRDYPGFVALEGPTAVPVLMLDGAVPDPRAPTPNDA